MPTYSQAPPVARGRIRVFDQAKPNNPSLYVIAFQFNPATLSRTLQPPAMDASGAQGQRSMALRYKGAPAETLNVDIVIDATDQLELGHQQTKEYGILPQLAVLETLLYPTSDDVKKNDALLDQGQIEVASGYDAPFTLFEWGKNRTLPVVVTSLSITEDMFDKDLNPIIATVKLGLRTLSYSDVVGSHPGYSKFMAYQGGKEQLAVRGR